LIFRAWRFFNFFWKKEYLNRQSTTEYTENAENVEGCHFYLCPLCSGKIKINNELRRTQNELTLPEFVSVRFSSVFVSIFFSCSFLKHISWLTLWFSNQKIIKNLCNNLCELCVLCGENSMLPQRANNLR
jgi:hypothetical protein